MYSNIGRKIKGLATVIFIFEALVSVITGFYLMSLDEEIILVGLLVLVVGSVAGWVSSWMLYGFGELIDKVSGIERNTRGGDRKSETQTYAGNERIRKIQMLRAQGLISEEEYQQAISAK